MPLLLSVSSSLLGYQANFSEDVTPDMAMAASAAIFFNERTLQETRARLAEYGPMDLEQDSDTPTGA